MASERMTFEGHDGSTLSARLDAPDGPTLATALFAHCFTCTKDIVAARRISARLSAMGIAVLRFDFTGLGHSDGEFANTTFSSNAQDLLAASAALTLRGMAPDILIGHSLGGAAVLRAAAGIPSAKAVVTLGAPFDPEHVTANFKHSLSKIRETGTAEVTLGGRPFRISQAFVDDVSAANLKDDIARMNKALLVMHAPKDSVVGIDNAARIFETARHPKSFVTLDNTDHLITDAGDAEYAADMIATWAQRYVPMRQPAPPPGAPEGVVRVSEADPAGFLQDVNAGPDHHALADEPEAYGGTNRGMTPYGFLSAGLGACTSMTIRMYARRKGWPLTHVAVDVCHDKVHAQDAEFNGTENIDAFRRRIYLSGPLSADQRKKLMEIADKCPVHKTLEKSSQVITELAEFSAKELANV